MTVAWYNCLHLLIVPVADDMFDQYSRSQACYQASDPEIILHPTHIKSQQNCHHVVEYLDLFHRVMTSLQT